MGCPQGVTAILPVRHSLNTIDMKFHAVGDHRPWHVLDGRMTNDETDEPLWAGSWGSGQ